MLGAITIGETIISGLLEGEDVLATAAAMKAMGAKIDKGGDGLWRVFGVGVGGLKQPDTPLDMGNSGTSTRLLMGLLAGHPIHVTLTGDASLTKRPMKRVMAPLEQMGATFDATGGDRLPLTVHGSAEIMPISYTLPVASAQVKSAILLAGLSAPGTTIVIEPHPTRDHTENMLRHFGVEITSEGQEDGSVVIKMNGQQELQPGAIDVPGDPSSAAFPAVAALLVDGSDITLSHIGMNERRRALYDTLIDMGADIEILNLRMEGGEPVANLRVRGGKTLQGINVPESRVPSMIDEFPVLAMAAACAQGTTRMAGLAELRVKESDRLLMVAKGLEACGVKLEMGEDWLAVHGTGHPPKGGATIETALDHRIAMSFLVLGCATEQPVTVDDGTPIATSFPDFVVLMNDLGADIGPIL